MTDSEIQKRMQTIKLVAMDVDGTYTNGQLFYDAAGEVIKSFHAQDGFALEILRLSGILRGFITGRSDKATIARATYLGVDFFLDNTGDKKAAMERLQSEHGLVPGDCMFIGDDINDIPAFEAAGLKIAVANATDEVKSRADYITVKTGGEGAVREVVDMMMEARGVDTATLWVTGKRRIAGSQ